MQDLELLLSNPKEWYKKQSEQLTIHKEDAGRDYQQTISDLYLDYARLLQEAAKELLKAGIITEEELFSAGDLGKDEDAPTWWHLERLLEE